MKTTAITLAACVALAGIPATAAAGEYREQRGHDAEAFYIDAPVVEVRPLVRVVEVSRPERVCWDEEVERVVDDRPRGPSTATVVGTIVGGAIGRNTASKSSRRVATAAGAVLGAVIGRDIGRAHRRPPRRVVTTETRCEVERSVREEERIDGYRVFYRYGGRTFETRSEFEPGDTIRVRVGLSPVR